MSAAEKNALIGERVRFHRTAKNLSMEKLCEMMSTIKITHQQLARYETNQARWPADTLCEVAMALQVDIRLLVGGEPRKRGEEANQDVLDAERHKILLLEIPDKCRRAIYSVIGSTHAFAEENKR